jgi:hypothetical protein
MSHEHTEKLLKILQEKLNDLECESLINSDPNQRFQLKKEIEKCQLEIKQKEIDIAVYQEKQTQNSYQRSFLSSAGLVFLGFILSIFLKDYSRSTSSDSKLSEDLTNNSAQQLVIDYYAAINQGNYRESWDKLPNNLRNNSKLHPKGYLSFEEYFNKTAPIDIKSIKITEKKAVVNVYFTYNNQGKKQDMGLNFKLFFDENQNEWRIESITKVSR